MLCPYHPPTDAHTPFFRFFLSSLSIPQLPVLPAAPPPVLVTVWGYLAEPKGVCPNEGTGFVLSWTTWQNSGIKSGYSIADYMESVSVLIDTLSFYDQTSLCTHFHCKPRDNLALVSVWCHVWIAFCVSGYKQKDELMNVGQSGCRKRRWGSQEVQGWKRWRFRGRDLKFQGVLAALAN